MPDVTSYRPLIVPRFRGVTEFLRPHFRIASGSPASGQTSQHKGVCRHFSLSPAVLRFEDPQETALLLADAPRTRAKAGAERNDARSGSALAKELTNLRMQAARGPRSSY